MLRVQTQLSYEDRLNRVTDYVYAHLEGDISFETLADVACLSPYHWSRIYAAMRGETIAVTIRRLRLQRAADRLANSDLSLADIAARAGYGSTEAFARAFKAAFDATPAVYRQSGSHAAFKQANALKDAQGFPVQVEVLSPRRCAGMDHAGSYMQIDQAMGRLFSELIRHNALPAQPAMMGIFYDDPDIGPEAALRSRACLTVDEDVTIEAPLQETRLRGGLYARLAYTGPYADMREAYRWLLGVWLPASGYEPDDAPVFEAYLNDPREVPQNELRTDIHLPLKGAG